MGFFEDYFIRPTLEHTGYNMVNTIAYAIILIVALFAVYKILVRTGIKPDRRLWIDLLPFIFLGGALRALQDINFFGFLGVYHVLFVTPMIYIIIFLLAFAGILVSKYIWKNFIRYFGIALLAAFLAPVLFSIKNPVPAALIIFVAALSYAALYCMLKYVKIGLLRNSYNSHIMAAHMLDASTAFVAVSIIGGYKESSVFTNFLFSQMPGWVFIPIKAAIILVVLHFIDKDSMNEMNWLLKFAILVLGLGPGLHNLFSVLMGSNMV
ncbi:MAG: DUF63 family protein [Candidatus Aenigmarchaeota archaeon]|nr:DUF63 family protein [Candidatus Aenigmarchaeota archaeon]MDI6721993.1 DUF63 family protein [Candidatus Aenigmarchaeota archaeon]